MLTQVVLQTATPVTFDIEAVDPDEILVLKSISGLSAADMSLFSGEFARDGGYYQGRRVIKRNPVFNFKINPNYAADISASDIREMLYEWFMEPNTTISEADPSDGLMVTLIDDRKPDRYVVCYPEMPPESDIFSRDLSAQISTICFDPFIWSSELKTITDAAGLISLPVAYVGSTRAGFKTTIKVTATTSTVVLTLNGHSSMTLSGSFVANDILVVNTKAGERSIKKNGIETMGGLSATSKWLELVKGTNTLSVHGGVVNDGKAVVTNVEYREAWWGV